MPASERATRLTTPGTEGVHLASPADDRRPGAGVRRRPVACWCAAAPAESAGMLAMGGLLRVLELVEDRQRCLERGRDVLARRPDHALAVALVQLDRRFRAVDPLD